MVSTPSHRHLPMGGEGRVRSIADWLGIAASSACALHCIVVPTLLVTGTVLPASIFADGGFHLAMIWIIIPVAVLAFGIGCWRHKDRWVMALGLIGVLGMVSSITVFRDLAGEAGERVATLLSAAVLIVAHYRNYKICRSTGCTHEPI